MLEERQMTDEEIKSNSIKFLKKKVFKDLVEAAQDEGPALIDWRVLDKFDPLLAEALLNEPDRVLGLMKEAVDNVELPGAVTLRFSELPDVISVRDLRVKHIGKFLSTEGIVRKASEIRPEVMATIWECPLCGDTVRLERKGTWLPRPTQCNFGNKREFKQKDRELIDTRWISIEEPFELTEGDRPSQVIVVLQGDLTGSDGRRITEPGSRLRISGILRDVPKAKLGSSKLDFYLEANWPEPIEIGWERINIKKEDEKTIRELAKDPLIYEKFIDSLAPSLYGLREIKESIILQLFGGVPLTLADKTRARGDIHILLIGEPASGKSQLLKLVPQIVPRGRYVSGKGVTGAGLTASVSKDEQFMGGWVLEAGAMVLANRGLLAVDEFEKMNVDDQVAMHEGLEQGSVSIAKASIVATLPAQTSVLAGGNPKFSRFDPYMEIAKQITIPDTLLSRFDLKFILKDIPDPEQDRKIVEHILAGREDSGVATPLIDPGLVRKYIAYAKEHYKPKHTRETGKMLKQFYIEMRKKAKGGAPIPITLRQFESLLRLAQASAKMQLRDVVNKDDVQRAIRLMQFSLHQLGYDPHTGTIDVDRAEGITSQSERSHIRIILDIIDTLAKIGKKDFKYGEIEELARKEGVSRPEDVIERLKREGLLFEPQPGYLRKV